MNESQRITQSHAEGTAARLARAIAEAVKWPGGRGPDFTLMTPDELPDELTERVQAHNAVAGQTLAALKALPGELRTRLDKAGIEAAKLRWAVDKVRARRVELLGQLVDLIRERGTLAAEAGEAMKTVIGERNDRLTKARESVKRRLATIGIDATTTPAGRTGANAGAAEIQLSHQVNNAAEVQAWSAAVAEANDERQRLHALANATAQDMAAPEAGLRKALTEITAKESAT